MRRYKQHWSDRLVHIVMFEALSDTQDNSVGLSARGSHWSVGYI